ncbi:MAG: copper-binding protein [Deltaproteobacteria bacterium]|nr:copper-binding protein [Deltaproteobacteria bacterium]
MPKKPARARLFLPSFLAVLLALTAASPLWAQGHSHSGHGGHDHSPPAVNGAPAAPAGPSAILVSRGVVRQIDTGAGTVVLDHEAIPELNWGPMTMEFRVEDSSLLDGLKTGARVRFDLKVTGMGRDADYAITDLEEE